MRIPTVYLYFIIADYHIQKSINESHHTRYIILFCYFACVSDQKQLSQVLRAFEYKYICII